MDVSRMMALGFLKRTECLRSEESGVVRGLKTSIGMSALNRAGFIGLVGAGDEVEAVGYATSIICIGRENWFNHGYAPRRMPASSLLEPRGNSSLVNN